MPEPNENPVDEPIVEIPGQAAEEPPKPETIIKDGGIEVVIGEEPQTPPPAPEPRKPEPPDPVHSLRNKVFAQDRIITGLRRQIEEQTGVLTEVNKTLQEIRQDRERGLFRAEGNQGQGEDDVDKLVREGNWKKGVDLMIARKVSEFTAQQKQQIDADRQKEEVSVAIKANINSVLQRHPELDDPMSEKFTVYNTVLDENPKWRNSPDGPLLAMYVMEDRMRATQTPSKQPPAAPVPVRPGQPVGGAASLPPGKPAGVNATRVFLTPEQKQICDDNNIPYEEYAKSLGALNRGEGKVGISV